MVQPGEEQGHKVVVRGRHCRGHHRNRKCKGVPQSDLQPSAYQPPAVLEWL